jgi:DNA-binding NarL/FixJ family response regulator
MAYKRNSPVTLTEREREIVEGVACGHKDKRIGYDVGLTSAGVRYHIARLMKRFRAESRGALVDALFTRTWKTD